MRGVKGLTYFLVFLPLPLATMSKGESNSMGVSSRNESLLILLANSSWKKIQDDECVEGQLRAPMDDVNTIAIKNGAADQFRYLNYAASGQNVISGYGATSEDFLRETSRKYDPPGLFHSPCAGGFKIFG